MDGEFNVQDKTGEVIFASSPGMSLPFGSSYEQKASKSISKKQLKRPLIGIFNDLSVSDTDSIWADRFEKMAAGKFPSKFVWSSSIDEKKYGTLFYKNRRLNKSIELLVDEDFEDIRDKVKKFIESFASSTAEEDMTYQGSKADIVPFPWSSLKIKEKDSLIEKYVSSFAMEHGLNKDQANKLHLYILLYSINKDIGNKIDYDGTITFIQGIYKDPESGYYKIK